jgi:hypothetical protein
MVFEMPSIRVVCNADIQIYLKAVSGSALRGRAFQLTFSMIFNKDKRHRMDVMPL